MFRKVVERRRDGSIRFNLDEPTIEVLQSITEQVREKILLLGDPDTVRLTPPAHPDSAELNAEFVELQGDRLLAQRLDDLDLLERTGTSEFTIEELDQWIRAVNAVRLVLGTRLDVSEEDTYPDESDPNAGLYWVYTYLGMLQFEAVQLLTDDLPPPTED